MSDANITALFVIFIAVVAIIGMIRRHLKDRASGRLPGQVWSHIHSKWVDYEDRGK